MKEVEEIAEEEVKTALKKMKKGNARGSDDIPVEVWLVLGDVGIGLLTKLMNNLLKGDRMPDEWRKSVLIPIYKGKGDSKECGNYRGIKLMSHTMKLWQRVVEARLRREVGDRRPTIWVHATEKHHGRHLWVEVAHEEVEGRSERVALCVHRSRESL